MSITHLNDAIDYKIFGTSYIVAQLDEGYKIKD